MRYIIMFIILITYITPTGLSQAVYDYKSDEVGTIEFFRKGKPLSFPVAELKSGDLLELRFDIFSVERKVLEYKIELCNYNWVPVEEEAYNYIEGYGDYTLDPFSFSINTTVDYMHYRLDLPNNDIDFLKPGNYLISVYYDGDEGKVYLKKRFVIFEELTRLEVIWDKLQSQYLQTKQELNVKVEPLDLSVAELAGNIKLMVLQNNNWYSAKYFEKYTATSGNIVFNLPGQIVFNGINEFRFFDMKSFKFISERVQFNEYRAPNYHVLLKPDKLNGDKEFFTKEDLNGLFFIDNTDTDAEEITDADYAWVHFTLETEVPLPADIYIEGALTSWQYKNNFMEFNSQKGAYEKSLFLKQGLYNYRYVMREYSSDRNEYYLTEGEHFTTKNSYLAILYYQQIGEIYSSPVGLAVVSTTE